MENPNEQDIVKDTAQATAAEGVEDPQTAEKPNEAEAPKEKTVEEQLEEARQEVEDLKNKALYRQAEFENYRKRVIQEKADLIVSGGKRVLEALLPVVDDMERALDNIAGSEGNEALREGVELIYQKLMTTLKGQGVVAMETKDKDFSTDFHEAIAQLPAPTPELKGKILDCTKKGYLLHDKVLRYAQVVVGV